ncbi:MAG: molybdate ABC transporter substrate-binding protein, partial [Pseudonocardiaceae bacterium]
MKQWFVGIMAGGLVLAGCAGCGGSSASAPTTSAPPPNAQVTVLAAASLTNVFGQLKPEFERANPGADLRLNFGGSSDLAQQIVNGAPADVFASASTKNMDQVVTPGNASNPQNFAKNVMEIAVPPSNP